MGGLCYCRELHLQLKYGISTEIPCFTVSQHFLVQSAFLAMFGVIIGFEVQHKRRPFMDKLQLRLKKVYEIDVQESKEFRIKNQVPKISLWHEGLQLY